MANIGPDAAQSALDLVEQAYHATLDPLAYDAFMDAWTEFVDDVANRQRAAEADDATNAVVEAHFKRGLELLDRLGRARKVELSSEAIVTNSPTAAMIAEKTGRIVATNALAVQAFRATAGEYLRESGLEEHLLQDISDWALNSSGRYLLLQSQADNGERLNLLAARTLLSFGGGEEPNDKHREYILISSTNIELSANARLAITEAFKLSKSEVDVADYLVRGLTPAGIATQRSASINTVRTQIKALLKKVDAKNVSDLVRILCGFAVNLSSGMHAHAFAPLEQHTRIHRFRLPDGRQMAVTDQGDENGRPILFFHSMLGGVKLPQTAIETLARKGWRLIAPSRPGYGLSDTSAISDSDELVEQTARDFLIIAENLDLSKAVILGHLQGAIYAQRFAHLFPNRVSNLVFVSYAPHWQPEYLQKLPRRQRIVARTTRYAPRALRFIARAGVALIDAGRHDKFLTALHKDSPADVRALRRPDVYKAAHEGLDHTIRNGPWAFCQDCPIVLRDWSSEGGLVRAPISILIGQEDQVATRDYAEGYIAEVPGAEIKVIEGAGHHLLFSHWQAVLQHLEELMMA